MTDALSGNIMRNRMGQQEMASRQFDNPSSLTGPFSDSSLNGIGQSSDIGLPQPRQASSASPASSGVASVRNNNPGAQWPGPVANRFGATGSQTIGGGNKIATFPDPISGAAAEFALLEKNYSGMPLGSAITKWSGGNSAPAYAQHIMQATGLPPNTVITPQLLRSPQGVALAKAMADWEAGGRSPLGPQDWTRAQQRAFGGQSADLSGQIGGVGAPPEGGPAAPKGDLMAQGPQMAAGGGPLGQPGPQGPPTGNRPVANAPPGVPTVGSGGPPDPSLFMGRASMTREDFNKAMSSPWIPEDRKKALMDIYLNQGQPLQFQTPTGTYTYSPGTGAQGFTPGILQGDMTSGGTSWKGPTLQGTPSGGVQTLPGLQGAIGGGTPSVQQPSSNQIEVPGPSLEPPVVGGPPPSTPGVTPGPRTAPGPQSSTAPVIPGARYASLTPQDLQRSGASPAQRVPTPGPGSTPPAPPAGPGVPPTGAPSPTGATPPQPGGTPPGPMGTPPPGGIPKLAQAGPLPGGGLLGGLQQMDLDQDRRKKFIEHDQKQFADTYDSITKSGLDSMSLIPSFDLAGKALQRAYTGIGQDYVQDWNRLKAALGGDPKAAAALEIFDKSINESLTNMMRAKLQGLGQVRNKEIEIMQKASAGKYNTRQANEIVLDVAKREAQQMGGLSDVAMRYNQGQRYVNGKWYQTNETPTGNGLQEVLQKYVIAHPTMDDATIDKYMAVLDADSKAEPTRRVRGHPGGTPAAPAWQEGSPEPPPGLNVR